MFSLIKLVIKNSKAGNGPKDIKERVLGILSFIIVFGTLSTVMAVASSYIIYRLRIIKQMNAFTNILLLMNFFILFAESIFETLNSLYFSKDLKQFLTMPIKPWKLILAKIINIIKSEYMMELLMLFIPMCVYGYYDFSQEIPDLLYFAYTIIVLLLLPIIPIFITSLIVSIIMRVTHKIKNKNKVLYIVAILTIIAVSMIGMNFKNDSIRINYRIVDFTDMLLRTNGMSEDLSEKFIFLKPIMNIMNNYDNIDGLKNLLLFVAETIGIAGLCLTLMSKIYLKGAIGAVVGNGQSNNIQKTGRLTLKDVTKKNKVFTYIIKEIKTLIRTPIFAIQCIIMPTIYPLIVYFIIMGFAFFSRYLDYNLLEAINNKFNNIQGLIVFIGVGQVFFMMNFTSIIAISRDGFNSKFMKFIPIELSKQFNIKSRLGIVLNTIPAILMTIFFNSITHNIINSLLIFAILMLLNIMGEKLKIIIDLMKPWLDWKTEYAMMKQNTNVFYELFYTLIVLGALFLFGRIINNLVAFLLTIAILLLVLNIVINILIYKKQKNLFSKIY